MNITKVPGAENEYKLTAALANVNTETCPYHASAGTHTVSDNGKKYSYIHGTAVQKDCFKCTCGAEWEGFWYTR